MSRRGLPFRQERGGYRQPKRCYVGEEVRAVRHDSERVRKEAGDELDHHEGEAETGREVQLRCESIREEFVR